MDMLRWHLLHPLGQLLTDIALVCKPCSTAHALHVAKNTKGHTRCPCLV